MTITNNKIFGYSFTSIKVDDSRDGYLALPILYSIFLFVYSQWPALNHAYVINDDMVQHLVWLNQYVGNDLVAGDPLVKTSSALQPWGYWWLCRILVSFFEPIEVSRFFPLLPLMLTAAYTFRLIKLRYGIVLAMAGVMLMCNYPFERMVGFNARAFGYPLLMAFLYYFARRDVFKTCVVLLVSALFYPVITLLGSGILLFGMICKAFTRNGRATLFAKPNLSTLICMAVSAGLIALQARQIHQSDLLGKQFSKSELLSLPEFSEYGRVNFTDQVGGVLWQNFQWEHFLRIPLLDYLVWVLLAVLIGQLITQRKFRDFDQGLIGLLVVGAGLALLAQVLLPWLFFPERYIYYAFVPFLYLLVIRILGIFQRVFAYLIPMTLLLAGLLYEGYVLRTPFSMGLKDYSEYAGIYETVRSLPGQSMLAGPLPEMSHIPIFARQSVLFSEEAAHAIYFRRQHDLLMPRIDDFLKAYTSPDLETVKQFTRKYEIDYLLLKKSFFATNNMYVFRPFIGQLRESVTGKKPQDYALMNLPPELVLEIDDEYALVDCRNWHELE